MRLYEIVWGLLPWCIGAVPLMAAAYALSALAHRRAEPGEGKGEGKGESRKTRAVFALLVGYAFVVLGLTNFSREAGSALVAVNLVPLSSWTDGFTEGSVTAFQLIVFNVLMFVPLGVLLPMLSERLRRFYRVVLCALAFSLVIEVLQLHYATGIFEVDDLFHNTMGAALGYALWSLVAERGDEARRRRMAGVAGALAAYLAIFSLIGAACARSETVQSVEKPPSTVLGAVPLKAVEPPLLHPANGY